MWTRPQIKYPIVYGLIAALGSFLFILFLDKVLGINPLGGKKEVSIVFLIAAMIWVVYLVQKQQVNFNFSKGYGLCFLTTISFIGFGSLLLYIYLAIINTACLPQYIALTSAEMLGNKAQIIKNGIEVKVFDEALSNLKNTSVASIIYDDVIKKVFLSIIPSLMIALYYSKISKSYNNG